MTKGMVMNCEHSGALDVPDLMKQINRLRGGVLDAIISAGKEKKAEAEKKTPNPEAEL